MTEKDFGDALLRGQDPIDLAALTTAVLKRDRRRMWMLGIVCIIAWMLVVMLPWSTILPMLARVVRLQAEIDRSTVQQSSQQREQSLVVLQAIKAGTIATFVGSVTSMFLAATCTVLLIVLSRRATLRQINARLAEISAQLKAMSNNSAGGSRLA
jgi:hypothetical protein